MEIVGLFAALGCIELAAIAVLWDVVIVSAPLDHGRAGAAVFALAVIIWALACVAAGGMTLARHAAGAETCLDAADCLLMLAGVLAACNAATVLAAGAECAMTARRRCREREWRRLAERIDDGEEI